MKVPQIAFNKDAILSFLLNHVEKVGGVVIGLAACGLAWGGVASLRNMRPSEQQQPQKIIEKAAETAAHIEAVKIAPDDELTGERGLAETIKNWLSPKIVPALPHAVFSKPLFGELSKRSGPDILPLEDLRAVAGVVAIGVRLKVAGDRPAPERPLNQDVADQPKPAKPPRGRGTPAPPQPPAPPEMVLRPEQPLTQAKIVPYVLVTGLIPVAKQATEYNRRFGTAGFRDAVLDTPSWHSYRIERSEVFPGTAEKWTPIDMKSVAQSYSANWSAIQPESLLPPLVLTPDQERRDTTASPIPFCSPLPRLADGSWGFNALHPWFANFLQVELEKQKIAATKLREKAAASSDVFGPAAGPLPGEPDTMPGASGQVPMELEYRQFRFIDLAVVLGHTYRYRVRLACWNPNNNVPSQHLADAELAKPLTVESPPSNDTAPIVVPDSTRMLVQPTKKQELKRLKSGLVSVLILGQNPAADAFALRSLLMEVGGIANVDPEANKKGDSRSRGDAIETDRVLLDVLGKTEDRAETPRTGKPTPPPEPLEMIFLRPDGTFEVTSSADSQPDIDRYRSTLFTDEAAAKAQPPAGGGSPFGNPFGPKP